MIRPHVIAKSSYVKVGKHGIGFQIDLIRIMEWNPLAASLPKSSDGYLFPVRSFS